VCNCFTVKVFVSNFKVKKCENLDNAFYVFLRFFDMTLQKNVKSRVFWIFKKNVKNEFSNYGLLQVVQPDILAEIGVGYGKSGFRRTKNSNISEMRQDTTKITFATIEDQYEVLYALSTAPT